jgi:Ca2+-binding RTX toxin-like protein
MPTVTVAGTQGQVVSLTYDSAANAALAQKLAAAITFGLQAGTVVPAVDTDGPPPPVPAGKTGEWVQTQDGTAILPAGYKAVVDTAQDAIIFGSGDTGESVLSSTGDLNFFASKGSGTVAAGGGDNRIVLLSSDTGSWSINTGNGDDDVLAGGTGNDTVNAGGGENSITLGTGHDIVLSTGDDTVIAGSGEETIAATGKHRDLVYGNSSKLFFVTTEGSATIFGGTGSDTFFGGKGTDLVYGGTGGNNFLVAGTGHATLFGAGNGDQLFGMGNKAQALHAGAGNETLFGGAGADTFYGGSGSSQIFGGFGADTFVAGTGGATITAGLSSNLFAFYNGQAGGTESISGFVSGRDLIDLQGYGTNEVTKALKSQQLTPGGDVITLSDHTTITFAGIGSLSASDFVTSSGSAGGTESISGSKGHHAGMGDGDVDNHAHLRNGILGSHS